MQNKQSRAARSQKGSVFFYILIAVALFAALGFTFTRSMKGQNTNRMSTRQAELAATDIIDYAQKVAHAVDRVRRNNCSENELSFERPPFDGSDSDYENPDSPSDFSCHIFHPDGGDLTHRAPPEGTNNGSDWFFGINRVGNWSSSQNHGTAAQDLTMILNNVDYDVCTNINALSNKLDVWESSGAHNSSTEFKGSYASLSTIIEVRGSGALPPSMGCFCDNTDQSCPPNRPRYFYYIVLAR